MNGFISLKSCLKGHLRFLMLACAALALAVLPHGAQEALTPPTEHCTSRWDAGSPPVAAALFEGSCGSLADSSWTAGGEEVYCPTATGTGNRCLDCSSFTSSTTAHQQWLSAIEANRTQRHSMLTSWLEKKVVGEPVMLMALNSGFMYFFENWVRQADSQSLSVRHNTLVLTDEASQESVRSLGFRPVSTHDFASDILFVSDAEESTASPMFASAPSHPGFNAMALVALSDLIQLGVDVLWMDADTVLRANPLPWLTAPHPYSKCNDFGFEEPNEDSTATLRARVSTHWPDMLCYNTSRPSGEELVVDVMPDLQFMDDTRWDSAGPGNTGFAFFRSNCRTLDLSRAVLSSLHVLLGTQSDQRFLMRLLHGPLLRDISMALLPTSLFLNGPTIQGIVLGAWQRQPGMISGKDAGFPPQDWIAGHASWVNSHAEKPPLLRKLDAWHMLPQDNESWAQLLTLAGPETL